MIFSFLHQVQVYTLLSVLENPWEIHQLFLLTSGYVGYHIGCGANARHESSLESRGSYWQWMPYLTGVFILALTLSW